MKIDLAGRVALVTGATRGIGRASALALAGAGADVAAVATNPELLKTVRAEIERLGVRALGLVADAADEAQVEAAVQKVAADFGKIDILVNNAGITRDNLILRIKSEDWDRVLDVDLRGPFYFLKAVCRHMLRRGGRIINISSISGLVGNAGQANYAAAKAGILGLTKSAAKELASRNILVNAVAPGFIETDMTKGLDEKVRKEAASSIPLGRFGKPEEVAGAVLFLASDLAGYVTGQVLVVDGGMAGAF